MTPFKHTDPDGDRLLIEDSVFSENGVYVEAKADHARVGVYVAPEAVPAVALALFRAVGLTPKPGEGQREEGKLHAAVALLQEAVLEADEEAARKADEEALDREALELLNAATDSGYATMPDGVIASVWRKAARRAREIHS